MHFFTMLQHSLWLLLDEGFLASAQLNYTCMYSFRSFSSVSNFLYDVLVARIKKKLKGENRVANYSNLLWLVFKIHKFSRFCDFDEVGVIFLFILFMVIGYAYMLGFGGKCLLGIKLIDKCFFQKHINQFELFRKNYTERNGLQVLIFFIRKQVQFKIKK